MEATRTHVSASRVGSMLGMDPRNSALSLYHQMRGTMPPMEDNDVLKEGRYFEDAIARIAAEKYGFTLDLDAPLELKDESIVGHPDRWFIEDGKIGVLEIKNTLFGDVGDGDWGEPHSDQVPKSYWLQAQTYAGLAHAHPDKFGYPLADYALLAARLRTGTTLYKIPFDPQVYDRVKREANNFVVRVQMDDPPDPQDEQDARMRWMVTPKKRAFADHSVVEMLREIQRRKKVVKGEEQVISDLQMRVLLYAQDAELLVFTDENGVEHEVASLGSNRKFDADACLRDHPELLERYAKLDATKLGKEQKRIYEAYMKRPENVVEQTRVLRIKLKEEA